IPVITTLMGIGAYPPAAVEALVMRGSHGSVTSNKAVRDSVVMLGAGVRFAECDVASEANVNVDNTSMNVIERIGERTNFQKLRLGIKGS
ncbi:MAG: hypothetical protein KJ042_17495, partial [Deltaproteobacteria bacterium]|nr:hypothetical protein [Deltaproteobacteria bacterium]